MHSMDQILHSSMGPSSAVRPILQVVCMQCSSFSPTAYANIVVSSEGAFLRPLCGPAKQNSCQPVKLLSASPSSTRVAVPPCQPPLAFTPVRTAPGAPPSPEGEKTPPCPHTCICEGVKTRMGGGYVGVINDADQLMGG